MNAESGIHRDCNLDHTRLLCQRMSRHRKRPVTYQGDSPALLNVNSVSELLTQTALVVWLLTKNGE